MAKAPPKFNEKPTIKLTPEGSLLIACAFDANPKPTISWQKDGQVMESGDRIVAALAENGASNKWIASLTIKKPTADDGGLYKCISKNDVGSSSASINLNLAGANKKVEKAQNLNWDWPLQKDEGFVTIKDTSEVFEVELAAHFFAPKDIRVTVIGQDVAINCRHEEKVGEHGSVAREIMRCYRLPNDVDGSTLTSLLNEKGILEISAKKKK